MNGSSPFALCSNRKGQSDSAVRVDGGTVCLTQAEIADRFGTSTANVNIRIRDILKERGLPDSSVVEESLITAAADQNCGRNVDRMLEFNERPVLHGAGRVSHERMKVIVSQRYEEFDGRRREAERLAADAEDLRALEETAKSLEVQQKGLGKKGDA